MHPTGGKKDVTPPKLVSVSPPDSLLDTTIKRIEMHFNEYVNVSNPSTEVEISPILSVAPIVTAINKRIIVKIADTLEQENTTYRITFGKAIQDVHEGNVFRNYTYTFSTGKYFDSLQLSGDILNAATGLPDTGKVYVVLYSASRPDSAIVREKPLYVAIADANGHFVFKGLPAKKFRIYGLKDANGNLIYDGNNEWIGFRSENVQPGDSIQSPILLKIFPEVINDTSKIKKTSEKPALNKPETKTSKNAKAEPFNYIVNVDTSDIKRRTQELTKPIGVTFNRKIGSVNSSRITLTYDSIGITVEALTNINLDTQRNELLINTQWQENMVYTLRLLKSFVKDTSGTEALPWRYTFRTKRDEDYGKLEIHLPVKYVGKQYLLMVMGDKDTVYTKPILDTIVYLSRLQPDNYTMRIIVDKNENGKWDTGDLFAKIQPEEVIPYNNSIPLKAGWEHTVDFVQTNNGKKPGMTTHGTKSQLR